MSIIKIGDLKKIKNKLYQCIPRITDGISVCGGCDLANGMCMDNNGTKLVPCSGRYREDCADVIFKELIKFGEPYINNNKTYQAYRLPMNIERLPSLHNGINLIRYDMVEIETDAMSEKAINLKPFNIDEARAGKPVCTRDGRKARIICFDRTGKFPIVALVEAKDRDDIYSYLNCGKDNESVEKEYDLMMLPEKKEGWVNVYHGLNGISERVCGDIVSKTKEEAIQYAQNEDSYITTVKIEWEE